MVSELDSVICRVQRAETRLCAWFGALDQLPPGGTGAELRIASAADVAKLEGSPVILEEHLEGFEAHEREVL